jgi:hypothetical protein
MVGALFLSEPEFFFCRRGGYGRPWCWRDRGWGCWLALRWRRAEKPRGLLQAGKPAPLLGAGMRGAGAGPRGDFCRTEASATFGPR